MTPSNYLAVCAIYRDEGPYLREWVEFHRLAGVERFYLYDNGSTDEHEEVLRPYVEEGLVELNPWPIHPAQIQACRSVNPSQGLFGDAAVAQITENAVGALS